MHSTLRTYGLIRAALILLCGIIPFLAAAPADGQTSKYEIRYGNNAIGQLNVKQETSGNNRKISIQSRVQSKFFQRMELDILAEYHHDILSRSRVTRLSTEQETLTEKTEKGYTVLRKGDKKSVITDPQITFCVSDLYFNEPRDVKRVYSETLGRFLEVKLLPDKRYALLMPEGKKNIYRYDKGRLTEVEINHQLGKAWFKLLEYK
ncbi:DUF6134 family protein [Chitinophaga barathri]|uniref:DUF3108 domain-containing protein n=1 Tax=Chitinophaga barathri TaxID=1647451 RepID=A0A3N4MAN1_9BACT|nr:DUF6134 family protein [Chitinophaga barathri]RPD40641.1 hypothetical protein EG028_15220 [Chitinophaga barathri]